MLLLLYDNCVAYVYIVLVFHSLAAALSSQANKESYKPVYTFKGLYSSVLFVL